MSTMAQLFSGPVTALDGSEAGWSLLGGKTSSGVEVTEASAMNAAAVFACVRNIAEDIAKLPLVLYRRRDDDEEAKDKARDHPLYAILKARPNPEMTSIDARQALAACAVLYGRGFMEIVTRGGRPAELWPVHPSFVTVDRNSQGRLIYRITRVGSLLSGRPGAETVAQQTLDESSIVRVNGFGETGVLGSMIARLGSESIALSIAAERFAASFFGNGAVHSGIMKHPKTLSEAAQKRFKQQYKDEFSGISNAFRLLLLEEGMEFERVSSNPEEAQVVEARQFQIEDVARWFRMPPHKIQHLARSTFSNIEHQGLEYKEDTMQVWLVRHEQEYERKLLTEAEQSQYVIQHNADALMRTDALTRARVNQIKFLNGAITQDEWRGQENMNPLPDHLGDRFYVQRNIVPVDRIDEEQNQGQAAANRVPDDGRDNNRVSETFAPLIEAAAEPILRKQLNAFTRKAAKLDAAGQQDWLAKFAADHTEQLAEAIARPLLAMARMICGNGSLSIISTIEQAALEAAEWHFGGGVPSGGQWLVITKRQLADKATEDLLEAVR